MTDARGRQRAANRAAMPLCAAAIDEARRVFGDRDMKVIWMSENGKEVGKRKPAGDWEMSADAYIGLHQHYRFNGLLGGSKRGRG